MEDFSQDSFNPFDRFFDDPNLNMLNSALPYVGDFLRKPLALYIKILEINRIAADFDKKDVLTACGFEDNQPNLENMLKAMKAAGGKDTSPQIDSMLNMLNFIRMYQSCMELMQNNPELVNLLNNLMNQKDGSAMQADSLAKLLPFFMSQQNQNQNQSQNQSQGSSDLPDMMGILSEFLKKQDL